MFGRKKKNKSEANEDVFEEEIDTTETSDTQENVAEGNKNHDQQEDQTENDEQDENNVEDDDLLIDDYEDEWVALDAEIDRDNGPFDIEEVDLDADDVERIDLGGLVVTPFEDMKLQLRTEEASQKVIDIFAIDSDKSAIQVALIAAPKNGSNLARMRKLIVDSAEEAGGSATVKEGPFGAEVFCTIPAQGPNGEKLVQYSRSWLVPGPRWVLRGILFGEAANDEDVEGEALKLFEFFCNLVVRRGHEAVAAGSLIPLKVP